MKRRAQSRFALSPGPPADESHRLGHDGQPDASAYVIFHPMQVLEEFEHLTIVFHMDKQEHGSEEVT